MIEIIIVFDFLLVISFPVWFSKLFGYFLRNNEMNKEKKDEIVMFVFLLIMLIFAIVSMLWLVAMLKKYPDGLPWL